jgi:tetratricopeptide (TPR) repeat protein
MENWSAPLFVGSLAPGDTSSDDRRREIGGKLSIAEKYNRWVSSNSRTGSAGLLVRLAAVILDKWCQKLDQLANYRQSDTTEVENGETFYLRARALARAGKFPDAVALLARATDVAPGFPDAFEAYGELLDMAGQSDRASSMHVTHRKLRGGIRRAAPDRAFVLRRVGRFADEVAAFSTLVRHVDNRAFPYVALGNAHLAQGAPRKAYTHYVVALRCKPGDPDIMNLKAEALSMMGRYDEAAATFDRVLEKRPENTNALSGRAIAYLARGQVANATADWRRQLALLPPERASARACVALRLADYAATLPELVRALEKEPNDPYWHIYRLTALQRLGQPTSAACPQSLEDWPAPLAALHAGRLPEADVLQRAGNGERRAEALFQIGVLALPRDPARARHCWQLVVDQSAPTLIEHAAARHELAQLDP